MTQPFAPPDPPYYAVVFVSLRSGDNPAYARTAEKMEVLAREHPGCLGLDSARGADGLGITVSYWRDEESIRSWKSDARHLAAQILGATAWYSAYSLHVAHVERSYRGPRAIV
ncbi:MAG: antibiotic biosynthesis monooxygenase [Rhodobacteraceae bacterium]|nr:antibiotic biosynthesis monooxygenase [Paracoccaceae bacterium]